MTESRYSTGVGTKREAGEEEGEKIAHTQREFHLCSGQVDVGGLPDTFHSARVGIQASDPFDRGWTRGIPRYQVLSFWHPKLDKAEELRTE